MKRLLLALMIVAFSLLCFVCAFATDEDFEIEMEMEFEMELEMEFEMEAPGFENDVTGDEVRKLLEALFSSAFKTESGSTFHVDIDKTTVKATLFDKPCEIVCWLSYRGNHVLLFAFEEPDEGDIGSRAAAAQEIAEAVALQYGAYDKAVITVPGEDGRHEEKRLEAPSDARIVERAFDDDQVVSLLVWWEEIFVFIERKEQSITIAYLPPQSDLDTEYVQRIDEMEVYRFD